MDGNEERSFADGSLGLMLVSASYRQPHIVSTHKALIGTSPENGMSVSKGPVKRRSVQCGMARCGCEEGACVTGLPLKGDAVLNKRLIPSSTFDALVYTDK